MPWKLDDAGNVVSQDGKPVFVHGDGKEVGFDADGTLATIGRLNGEAKGHREAKEAAETKLKAFDGIEDAAAARKALETVRNLEDKKLIDAGEVERIKTEMSRSLEQQYKPYMDKATTLEAQLNQHLVGGAFARSKFIADKFAAEGPAGVEIALALFGNRLKVEDGRVVGYDNNGNKLYSQTRHGELADAEEAIEQLVNAYPHKDHILKGSGASGSGTGSGKGGGGGGKSLSRAQFDQLPVFEQGKFVRGGGKITD